MTGSVRNSSTASSRKAPSSSSSHRPSPRTSGACSASAPLKNDILALGSFSDAADIDVDHPEIHASLTRAQTFVDHSKDFERLTLYEQRVNRSIEKNRKQLDELQATRKRLRDEALREACLLYQFAPIEEESAQEDNANDDADPATSPQATDNPAESPENGFVFSTCEIERAIQRRSRLLVAEFMQKKSDVRQKDRAAAAGRNAAQPATNSINSRAAVARGSIAEAA